MPHIRKRYTCRVCGEDEYDIPGYWVDRGICQKCSPRGRERREGGNGIASQIVARMVKKRLIPPPGHFVCVDCGGRASAWEHRDYSKPLDVEPVCHGCNIKRGPAKPISPAGVLDTSQFALWFPESHMKILEHDLEQVLASEQEGVK